VAAGAGAGPAGAPPAAPTPRTPRGRRAAKGLSLALVRSAVEEDARGGTSFRRVVAMSTLLRYLAAERRRVWGALRAPATPRGEALPPAAYAWAGLVLALRAEDVVMEAVCTPPRPPPSRWSH